MVAILFPQQHAPIPVPSRAISFGTADLHASAAQRLNNIMAGQNVVMGVGYNGPPCIPANRQWYLLNLLAAMIYHGDPIGAPVAHAMGLNIDLYLIQETVRQQYSRP